MELFEFILILVLITTVGKVLIEVGGPLVNKLGDLARELASSKKEERAAALESEVVEELERRLARIEDRLDFLEELKAPEKPRALGGGHGLDRGAGPRGETDRDPVPGGEAASTDERTAGEP